MKQNITHLVLKTLGLFIFIIGCKSEKEVDYKAIKTMQDYSVPLEKSPWEGGSNKKVLFVFPHPDDEVAHGGTIAYLKSKGATIRLVTLTRGQDLENKKIRSAELACSVGKLKIDSFKHYDFYNNTWEDILNDQVKFWPENLNRVEAVIVQEIRSFKPYAVYTYDTIIGGYGNPEHIYAAKATLRAIRKTLAANRVEKVYLSTLPEKLEKFLVSHVPSYPMAVEKAGNKNLPEPTVAYDVRPYWKSKQLAALCHESEEHVMRNFYLKSQGNDSLHFSTFDREYYVLVRP